MLTIYFYSVPVAVYSAKLRILLRHKGIPFEQLASLALLLSQSPLDPTKLWMCDCGFAMTFAWINAFEPALDLPVDWPDAVRAYDERLHSFDMVAQELDAYRPAMEDYLEKAKSPISR